MLQLQAISFRFYEPHYGLLCIRRRIGQGKEKILVPAVLLQPQQQRIYRESLAPIFTVKENHRTLIPECTIVVLRSILKYLLHCTGTSRRVYYTTLCNGQQAILAYAVIEVLCNVGSERCCRLVTIEPCRDSNATTLTHARHLLHQGECRSKPSLTPVRRCMGKQHQGIVHCRIMTPGKPHTKMSGLHCSRATAGRNQTSLLGKMLANQHHLAIVVIGTQQSMPAHHGNNPALIVQ